MTLDDVAVSSELVCEACGEPNPPEAKWCEACGHDLGAEPKPACVACGERQVDELGYCLSCGHRQPVERDHVQVVDQGAAAVSDRGKRHRHNEDAVAVAVLPDRRAVLVVCDGVSSTAGSQEASTLAAEAARDALVRDLTAGEPPATALVTAAAAAQEQVSAGPASVGLAESGAIGAPSTTLVAVVAEPATEPDGPTTLTTGWVGDSRAYWVGAEAEQLLTGADHEIGGSLVKWIGADSTDPVADVRSTQVDEAGLVVVCSDGLWRYAAEPASMAELCRRETELHRGGLDLAEALVQFANESGGHDNISAAVWSAAAGEAQADENDGDQQ